MWTGFIWLGTGSRDSIALSLLRNTGLENNLLQLVAVVKVTCRLRTLDIDFFCASL